MFFIESVWRVRKHEAQSNRESCVFHFSYFELYVCRERPQIAISFLEWLGRWKYLMTGLDALLIFMLLTQSMVLYYPGVCLTCTYVSLSVKGTDTAVMSNQILTRPF